MTRPSIAPRGLTPQHARRRARCTGVLAASAVALVALLLPTLHRPPLRLIWNASASVPLGLYRVEPKEMPGVGDMVAVRPSPALARYMAGRRYVEAGVLLVKPVAAVSGATVCRRGLRLTIDGSLAATALAHDRIGRPLPSWSGCRRLGETQVFVIAPATPASFDSRYFGSVSTTQIVGRVVPVWTWS